MTFDPIEPYAVDTDDPLTRGRLLHAVARGDRRARLTLDEHRRAQPVPDPPPPARPGAVAAGRRLFHGDDDGAGPDAA